MIDVVGRQPLFTIKVKRGGKFDSAQQTQLMSAKKSCNTANGNRAFSPISRDPGQTEE
jgi:hypothetical protein